ncbi:MAG TPA: TrbI/VirB10 family protein, partial [Stenotrophomonas sp.]
INRKALLFLGGMVALLMVAGYLALRGAEEEPRAGKRQERVEVPDAPVVPPLPDAGVSAPIPIVPSTAPPPLPPMPEPPPAADDAYASPAARSPSLVERRAMDMAASSQPSASAPGVNDPSPSPGLQPTQATDAAFLDRPDTLLLRGTYVRCALETRIITDVSGFTSCLVAEPVYSVTGRRLLLPKGSKVLGQYGSGAVKGERVAVVWDRIVTPTGIDVSMASPGIDNLGSAGHPGQLDAHWGQRVASALFISLLSDAFKYYGEKYGPEATTAYPGTGAVVQDPFQSNTANTVQRLAEQAVDAAGQRPPTVTLSQGAIVNVYVSRDVDFSGVLATKAELVR